ncbi:MAG: hypothetical protein PHP06_03795 [Clostridia bacterium]|nr:hypothetical protein [Clostridia bacterium]
MLSPDLLGLTLEECVEILKENNIEYKTNMTASPQNIKTETFVKRVIRQKYSGSILEITYSFFYK